MPTTWTTSGCDSGANAILAAQTANAGGNGVSERIGCFRSDVFAEVEGDFDVIVVDPPFRWFALRDLLEQAVADEGYEMLGRFIAEVGQRLRPGGFVLLFFGTSGDVDHLDRLNSDADLTSLTVADRTIQARGEDVTYFVRQITC